MSAIESFLSEVSVIDTETTNLLPELAEVVEIAEAHYIGGSWSTQGFLLGAKDGIPPAASAKNNISNRMIRDLPTFGQSLDRVRDLTKWPASKYYVAHNSKYDQEVLRHAWSASDDPQDVAICGDQSRWLCTWRLSRHILDHDFDDMEYGLNFLRYKLDLPVPDGMRLHRASDDTYLCAILFEYLVRLAVDKGMVQDSSAIGAQLNTLCWSPIIQTTWPFGKHRGKPLVDIDNDYYSWALKNLTSLREDSEDYDMDLAASVVQVLNARLAGISIAP